MPHYRRPNSFRYLRAQLRPITQPIVWAPAAILAIISVFVWDFWVNQREFSWDFSRFRSPLGLSSEEQAIGADIDNTSLLMRDFSLSAVNPPNQGRGQSGQPIPGGGANNRAPALNLLGTNPQPGQLLAGNPFANSTGSSLIGAGLPGGSSSSSAPLLQSTNSLGLPGVTTAQNPTLPNNVLQQALTANQAQANSTTSGNTPTPGNGLRQPLPPTNFPTLPTVPSQTTPSNTGFPTLPTQPAPPIDPAAGTANATSPNSFTALTGGSSAAGVPPVPATPPNNFGQSFGQSPFNSNPFGQPQTGNANNPQTQQQQLNQSQNAPISPRAPGRYLGGGQINTFSDPLGTSSGN